MVSRCLTLRRGLLSGIRSSAEMQGEQAQPHLRSGWFRNSNNTGAYLSYLCHCLMENRHGRVVTSDVTPANGHGESAAAVRMARLCRADIRRGRKPTWATRPGFSLPTFALHASHRMWPRIWAPSPLRHRRLHHPPSRLPQVDQRQEAAAQSHRPLTGGRGDRVDVLACNLIRLANLLSPREGER